MVWRLEEARHQGELLVEARRLGARPEEAAPWDEAVPEEASPSGVAILMADPSGEVVPLADLKAGP